MAVNIEFECSTIDISPVDQYTINVIATEADEYAIAKTIIDSVDAEDIIRYFSDDDALLKAIGIESCKDYFDLEENVE